MKSKRIVKEESDELNVSMSVVCNESSPNDGLSFRSKIVTLEDGSKAIAFRCNAHTGYFRQVFVPWEFHCPELIDL